MLEDNIFRWKSKYSFFGTKQFPNLFLRFVEWRRRSIIQLGSFNFKWSHPIAWIRANGRRGGGAILKSGKRHLPLPPRGALSNNGGLLSLIAWITSLCLIRKWQQQQQQHQHQQQQQMMSGSWTNQLLLSDPDQRNGCGNKKYPKKLLFSELN